MDKAIIEECLKNTREMLETKWEEIASMKDENDGRIKVTAAFLISYKGNEQALKSSVTFGRKVTEIRESIINPDQLEMFAGNGQEAEPDEEEVQSMAEGRKTRRRGRQEA